VTKASLVRGSSSRHIPVINLKGYPLQAIQGIARYRAQVLEAIDRFKGYTHVAVVGGGACLLADDIRPHVNLREDRLCVAQKPQFALVHGLKAIG